MAAKTEVQVKAKGVNATNKMFAEVRSNISRLSGGFGRIMGAIGGVGMLAGGIAAAGVAAVKAAHALNEVNNAAMRAGETSSGMFQGLSTALSIKGYKMDIETLSSAMQRMRKETGRIGVAGFATTLKEISKLGSETERVTELTRVFGKAAGPQFAGMVAEGGEALEQYLLTAANGFSYVDDASYKAASNVAMGWDIVSQGMKSGWQQAMMDMVGGSNWTEAEVLTNALSLSYKVVKIFREIGRAIHGIASAIIDIFKNAFEFIKVGVKSLAANASGLAAWVADTKLGRAIGDAASYVGAAVASGAEWAWDAATDSLETANQNIGKNFNEYQTSIRDGMTAAADGLQEFYDKQDTLKDFAESGIKDLKTIWEEDIKPGFDFSDIQKQYQEKMEKLPQTVDAMLQLKTAPLPDPGDYGKDMASSFKKEMGNKWITAGSNEVAKVMNQSLKTAGKVDATVKTEKQENKPQTDETKQGFFSNLVANLTAATAEIRKVNDQQERKDERSENIKELLTQFKDFFNLQKDGWKTLDNRMAAIGVV